MSAYSTALIQFQAKLLLIQSGTLNSFNTIFHSNYVHYAGTDLFATGFFVDVWIPCEDEFTLSDQSLHPPQGKTVTYSQICRIVFVFLCSFPYVFQLLICSHKFCSYSWFISRMPCILNNLSRAKLFCNFILKGELRLQQFRWAQLAAHMMQDVLHLTEFRKIFLE